MDTMLLRIYQRQVVIYCKAVLMAVTDINRGLQGDDDRLWYGIPNLIVAVGNLNKTLWGTGRNAQEARDRQARRKPLRESLAVTDSSPLKNVKIRNDYEHLDERLEDWWDTSTNHNFVGALIGPRGSVGGDAISDTDILRWIDPTTGDVIFWGNSLNIPAVLGEVERLLPIAEAEAGKPHWDDHHQTSGGGG